MRLSQRKCRILPRNLPEVVRNIAVLLIEIQKKEQLQKVTVSLETYQTELSR